MIRAGSVADAAQVAAVQREGWFAAYGGIIPAAIIDRVTTPDGGARVRQTYRTRPWQRMLVAVAADQEGAAASGVIVSEGGPPRGIVHQGALAHSIKGEGGSRTIRVAAAQQTRRVIILVCCASTVAVNS